MGQNQLFGSFKISSGVNGLIQGDPTDNVLAAIASILDEPSDKPKPPHKPVENPQLPTIEEVPVAPPPPPSAAAVPPPSTIADPPRSTIADPPQSVAAGVDGYVKLGPGPLDALRVKWTARPAGDGNYFVDETIGDNSRAMTSGPMPKEDAIRFINERERDARQRFDALKDEMTGQRASATNRARNDNQKI